MLKEKTMKGYSGSVEDDDIIEMATRCRLGMLAKEIDKAHDGVVDNNEANGILLRDITDTAIKLKKLKMQDKAINQSAVNAGMVAAVIDKLGSTNPFLGEAAGIVIDADVSAAGEIDPDTLTLGRQRLTLEDAGVDVSKL